MKLNIRAEEWPRFRALFLSFFLFTIGLVWAGNTLRAELVNISMAFWSQAQLISAIVVIVISVLYTAYVDRISKDHMFVVINALGIVFGLANVPLLISSDVRLQAIGFLLLWVLYQLLFYIWIIHWGTYIIDQYDSQSAKRIFPLLGAARPLATTFAGVVYSLLVSFLQLNTLGVLVAWVALLGASFLFLSGSNRPSASVIDHSKSIKSPVAFLSEGIKAVFASHFARWMAIAALLVIAINTLTEYQVSLLLREHFQDSSDPVRNFSSFTAQIESLSNIVAFVFQLFIFGEITKRVNLGNMNLIYPTALILSTMGLVTLPGVATAAIAYVTIGAFRRIFRDPVIGLMANATPAQTRGRSRAIINGVISPAGMVIASLFLQIIPLLGISWLLPALLILLVGSHLVVALVLKREYATAIVTLLKRENTSFLLTYNEDVSAQELGFSDKTKSQWIVERISKTSDQDLQVFLAQILLESNGRTAIPPLIGLVRTLPPTNQAAILDMVSSHSFRSQELTNLYAEMTLSKFDQLRQIGIRGLGQIRRHDRAWMQQAFESLSDTSPLVLVEVIPYLMNSSQETYRASAEKALQRLTSSKTDQDHLQAINIIRQLGDVNQIISLLRFLKSKDNQVRLQATTAINALLKTNVPPPIVRQIKTYIPELLSDPVEAIRLAELRMLSSIPSPEAYDALIMALNDRARSVRDAALQLIVRVGDPIIPRLEDGMRTRRDEAGNMFAVALSKINNDAYRHLVIERIDDALDKIDTFHQFLELLSPFRSFASIHILENDLQIQTKQRINQIFFLLTASRDEASVKVIQESLASRDPRRRADAVEALESLTSPQLAHRIIPLLSVQTPRIATTATDGISAQGLQPGMELLLRFATGEDVWFRVIAIIAFAELAQQHPDLKLQYPDVNQDTVTTAFKSIDIRKLLIAVRASTASTDIDVQVAARAAIRMIQGQTITHRMREKENASMLSIVERMIMLKQIYLFESIPVDQLRVLASICDEEFITQNTILFREGDPGGKLYVVVEGVVKIGVLDNGGNHFTQLARYEGISAFGELTLFENSTRSATAMAETDAVLLGIRNEAIIVLIREHPDLSISLLGTLSNYLRTANNRVAELITNPSQAV